MERWTFLLQKDGDRSWLPLDSPDVEILEGRYRIVAQTNHPNTDISVRVCHLATEAEPPKRRIQKRSNRTNMNGLMVVTPFTRLQAGLWELSCFLSDPMSDLVGDTLHHTVRMRVAAYAPEDEWNPEAELEPLVEPLVEQSSEQRGQTQESQFELTRQAASTVSSVAPAAHDLAGLNVEIAQALGLSMDRLVEMTDQLSHQLVEEIFREFDFAPEAIAAADFAASSDAEALEDNHAESEEQPMQSAIDPNQLRIVLNQDGWVAQRGECLTIAGLIAAIDQVDLSAPGDSELAGAIAEELQIQLRDPQTSKVLFHACQPFPTSTVPAPFSFLCHLPDNLTTYLLLGEVLISGCLPGAAGVMVTLKTLNFTITIDPEELVEELQKVKTVLAASADTETMPEILAQFSASLLKEKARQGLDLSFLSMTAADVEQPIAAVAAKSFSTARPQILPPQIHQPEPALVGERKLQLPVFAGTEVMSTFQAEAVSDHPLEETIEYIFELAESDSESESTAELPVATPIAAIEPEPTSPLESEAVLSADSETSEPIIEAASGAEELARLDELSSPVRTAFQALNLQDRFFNRLSSLAADAELTTLLKLMTPTVGDTQELAAVTTEVEAEVEAATSKEVVVDDDPTWREWVKRAGSRSTRIESEPQPPAVNPLLLPPDEPMPTPIVEIITDEIVAGRAVSVRVKLPNLLPKIYVKLWVNDRQTRTLLDGPRWLVDFLPNGHGELEAITQLTAPFGSLEVRLEAIAVEMQTQRESPKVSLEREVLSPDLPDELFDVDF